VSDVKTRIVDFLLAERDKLRSELDEVETLLDLLDAGVRIEIPTPLIEPEPEPEPEPPAPSGGAERMKEIASANRRAVIRALSSGNRLTAEQISHKTGIPRGTLTHHLKEMSDGGRIGRELRKGSNSGRAPYLYWLLVAEPVEHHLDERTNVVLD